MTPTTLDECMTALMKELAPIEQIELLKCTKDDLIRYHHNLGQWIRNNWGLWTEGDLFHHMKSLGFIHQDDMSQSIIKEFWNRMNHNPSEINEDVILYKKYWDENKG